MRSGQSVGAARGAIAADSRTSAARGCAASATTPALKYSTRAHVRKRQASSNQCCLKASAKGCEGMRRDAARGPHALTGWGVREKASADIRSESMIMTAVAHASARIIRARQSGRSLLSALLPVAIQVRGAIPALLPLY